MNSQASHSTLKSYWQDFKSSAPGHRFKDFYERRQEERSGSGYGKRFLYVGLGLGLVIAGVVFLALPGPGLLGVALGLALIAGEFSFMASWLDRGEVMLREAVHVLAKWWGHLQSYQRTLCWVLGCLLILAMAGVIYEWLR
ncbi:putative transmembrane protein PGPGW [Prosthecobacter fusiformis]|uniref:Putative transmembrane protein PGPGW n=1 Tax=Prosthecobacter fusiformis TaxID=48464 RepID=A0A4R7S4I4_9BACT|nr:PGPGW domain-containing protein [Prosthecobacter fusiformis]TDU73342.1 putative transmembrane protein PGPGW [Prosthecobacter fusiformis]